MEQKIIFGRATNGAVQEDDLHTGTTELVDQQRLMGVAAGEPIGSMDVETLDVATGNRIPQPLQRRAKQNRTTVAVIQIAVTWLKHEAIGGNAFLQRYDLTGDRVVARLGLAGYPCIERASHLGHCSPPDRAITSFTFDERPGGPSGRWLVRHIIGTRRA
ncbi:hypothetical protein X732_30570 [Mesorhizobium sp. L2C066B000]|nr:hypothetical protein X732_30570 [Mesorhizobium sp. L2C066B000]